MNIKDGRNANGITLEPREEASGALAALAAVLCIAMLLLSTAIFAPQAGIQRAWASTITVTADKGLSGSTLTIDASSWGTTLYVTGSYSAGQYTVDVADKSIVDSTHYLDGDRDAFIISKVHSGTTKLTVSDPSGTKKVITVVCKADGTDSSWTLSRASVEIESYTYCETVTVQGLSYQESLTPLQVKSSNASIVEAYYYSHGTRIELYKRGLGAATVTVSDSYGRTKTISVRCVENISGASAAVQGTWTYSGSAIQPDPSVTYGGSPLVRGYDYTVSYSNNINAGTATITLTGKNNFTGTKSLSFVISPMTIARATVSSISDQSYTGVAIKPQPTVALGGKRLSLGTDYALSYSNNVNPGTATVNIVGRGNYTGNKTISFVIRSTQQVDTQRIDISGYTVYLGSDDDFCFEYNFKNRYIRPGVWVDPGGNLPDLVKDVDYTVSYSNNFYPGIGRVYVTGIGKYTGHCEETFKIYKLSQRFKLTAKKKAVKAKKLAKGKRKVRCLTVSGAVGKLTYKKVSGSPNLKVSKRTGVITVKKGTKKGTYKARIRVTASATRTHDMNWKTRVVVVKVKGSA